MNMLTRSVQMRTTLDNSVTTRSTHLSDGSLSRVICFFTMASKAISGVNSPTCKINKVSAAPKAKDRRLP